MLRALILTVFLLPGCALLTPNPQTGESTASNALTMAGRGAEVVAPFLPQPWRGILIGGGTVLGTIGAALAGREGMKRIKTSQPGKIFGPREAA